MIDYMNTRKQPNRFLAILLSVCMLFAMLPMGSITAHAAAGTVAYIGDKGYNSLDSAVSEASSGDIITLRENDDTSQEITISKSLTIELDGHDLTETSFKISEGNVVIRDRQGIATISSTKEQAFQASFNNRVHGTIYSEGGSLTLEGVNVNGYLGSGGNLPKAVVVEGGSVTINSGSFKGGNAGNSGGDAVYFHKGELTINGGTFTGGDGGGCGLSSSDKPETSLSIRNGTFVGGADGSAAFWLGENIRSEESLKEYFLSDDNYIVGTFNYTNVTIGSNLFLSSVYNEPENGTDNASNPATIELAAGDSVTLEPHVLGGAGGELTYEWYKDSMKMDNASGSTCTVNGTGDYTGDYHVVVTETGTNNRITVYWKVVRGYRAYNVWVGGMQVTEQNASDVFGDADGSGATVYYNAETKTLTLNGANITSGITDNEKFSAIISYDDLKIVLADGSENNIKLSYDSTSVGLEGIAAMSEGADYCDKDITVCGGGSLNIDIDGGDSATGIAGNNVTVDGGAVIGMTIKSKSGALMSGVMGESSVAIKNSTVTATGGNVGIKGKSVSITGESTVKASGTTYPIMSESPIGLSETLLARGRENAESDTLSDVTMKLNNNYYAFFLSSNTSTAAHYVEIEPASSFHLHAICGGTDCAHDGHENVIYTALDDGKGSLAAGVTTSVASYRNVLKNGNYYLTADLELSQPLVITSSVNICLNGHTLTFTDDEYGFQLGVTYASQSYGDRDMQFAVCDCSATKTGKIETTAEDATTIYSRAGNISIYGGTISGKDKTIWTANNKNAGNVSIYDGAIITSGYSDAITVYDTDGVDRKLTIIGGETGEIYTEVPMEMSGGTVNDEVTTYSDVTMTGGTINGQLKIYKNTGSNTGRNSVRISGSAKIDSPDGKAIYSSDSTSVDLEISGGTITAQKGYALDIGTISSKIYLSGSPVISGDSADVRIQTPSACNDAVLVFHAMNDENSVYEGNGFSISPISTNVGDKRYIAQGVTDSGMAEKLSLAGLTDYYLTYDETNGAIQMNERTYTVTLQGGTGYTLTPAQGSTSPVKKGGSYSFTVTVDSANKYYETNNFAVKANGTILTPNADGVYTISNIASNQTVTVEGVALDKTVPTAEIQLGENKWTTFLNKITFGLFFKDTQTVTIDAVDNESGVAKTEYFVSDTSYETNTALETAVGDNWTVYSKSFNIEPNSKNIIYVKVTDKVGNVGYASSNGIVLYTDAAQKTASISFKKMGTADVTAEVTLKGNTIGKIYCGDTLLTSGTHYTVNGGTITFKASWLNTFTAGDYTLTVHYNPLGVDYVSNGGNDDPATTTITLSVQKATGSVEITNNISKAYDGQPVPDVTYSSRSTGDVTVEYKVRGANDNTYTTTKPSAVDKYTVRVTVAEDGDYTKASATADFDITYLATPADSFDLSGTLGNNGWYRSDVTITPLEGYTVSGVLNGEYYDSLTISASTENVKIYLKNAQGQMTDTVSVGDIKIDKVDPSITVSGNTNSYMQRDTVKITASDGISGVAKVEVKKDSGYWEEITGTYGNGYTVEENGTYTFRVYDNAGNYKTASLKYGNIDTQKPVVTIVATHGGAAYTSGVWTNKDITLTPENETSNLGTTTYQYRVDGGEWQDYTTGIVISTDTDADGVVYEFMATSDSDVKSDVVSITVKRDTVAPEGDITIKENSIRQLLSAITFGLFFNEDVDVDITGKDDFSGVSSIQYYRSEEILVDDELTSLTGWTDYVGTIHETAEDAEKFIYYVKVTDKAGNITCFASNGVTFDLTAPSVTGVTNGFIYYTTQKVTVTDTNLASVALGSEPATLENGVLALFGNTDATYTITATDKGGNVTTVTVTMKTIASLSENIDGLTAENVKSADEKTITEVKTYADNVDTENATEEEKAALQGIIDSCDAMLGKITATENELSAVTDGIGVYDTDSVKSLDKEAIEELVERIDSLLNGGNLTDDEKQNLETVKGTAKDLLEKISETAKAGNTENIQNVQDVASDNVKPEDKEDLEAAKDDIEKALNDYADNYSEDEKEQFEETLKQIEEALEVIQRVEEAEETISALPESVSPDDTEAEEQIAAAKEQYDALSEYEKILVSDEAAEKLEDLLAQLGDYRIIEGNGSTCTKESAAGLTFIANGAYSKFTGIEIDGAVVGTENYTAESGSTVITLKPDYLNTLTAGEHIIIVLYMDGDAQGTFTIAEKTAEPTDTIEPTDEDSVSPETGDDFHIAAWIILMLISGGAVLTLFAKRRTKRGMSQ